MKGGSLKEGFEVDRVGKFKEEPHLSGAYIRTLVKQLTSSRTKNTMNPKPYDSVNGRGAGGAGFPPHNLTRVVEPQHTKQQPQQHKKQVRRRLHTSRPYQERLLNMAEARKEIVTALKFHRASMKQAKEEEPQPMQQQVSSCFEKESKIKSRRNPRIYPSTTTANLSNYVHNYSYSSSSYPTLPHVPFPRPASQNPPPSVYQPLNFTLPNQTLGLNLNFHDFNNIETSFYHNNINNNNNSNPFFYSSSSPSSSSSQSVSVAISQEMEPNKVADLNESCGGVQLPSMDNEVMAEIKSIGEQHQVEWNDTMNLESSARWFNFLKTMEPEPEVKAEDDLHHPFDEVIEFPSWLNTNDNLFEEHLNDYCSEEYYQNSALPCMEIGEIEEMDEEWLA